MSDIQFTKTQGMGNDFLIIQVDDVATLPTASELAREMCQRNYGAGADGIVFVTRARTPGRGLRLADLQRRWERGRSVRQRHPLCRCLSLSRGVVERASGQNRNRRRCEARHIRSARRLALRVRV